MPLVHQAITGPPATRGKMLSFQVYGGLIMMMIMAVHMNITFALTIDDLDLETPLETLPLDELEDLFDSSLEVLQSEILQLYDRHLENYYRNVDRLEGFRGSNRKERSLMPTFVEDFWHPGTGNMKFDNREVLKIDNITVNNLYGSIDIDKIFSLDLLDLKTIFLKIDGSAMIEKNNTLEPLYIRNIHTASLGGCTCLHSQTSKECACCAPGSCVCENVQGTFRNVCVPCGRETSEETCAASSPRQLKTKVVTAFEYFDPNDLFGDLHNVVVSWDGEDVSFYFIDEDGLQPVEFLNGILGFVKPITHLGYGENYMDIHGSVFKNRFLVTFSVGENDHHFVMLDGNSNKLKIVSSQMWHSDGTDMKVWNSGAKIIVGVQKGKDIVVHEVKEDNLHKHHIMPVQTLVSPGDETMVSWKPFSMNFESYILVVFPDITRIYHQNGNDYRHVQDLQPAGGLSSFQDIIPISIPSCRNKMVLVTGKGRNVVAFVWNGRDQEIQMAYSTTLDADVENWSTGAAHTDPTGFGPDLVLAKGKNGLVSLEIRASLEELPDPLSVEAQSLHQRILDLEDEYQKQESVMKTFQEKLSNSVNLKNTLVGPITIRNKTIISGKLTTYNLTKSTLYLEPVHHKGDQGIAKIDYYQHLEEHGIQEDRLDQLLQEVDDKLDALKDAVLTSDTDRIIDGKKTLLNGSVMHINQLESTHLTVISPIDKYGKSIPFDDIVRKGSKDEVKGTKVFTKLLRIGKFVAKDIDGIPVSDLVTTTDEAVIAGATYTSLVVDTMVISEGGVLGGVPVSVIPSVNENISLGNCTFNSKLAVEDLKVKSNVISGVDINRLHNQTLKTTGGVVSGSLEFTGELKVNKAKAKFMMGVDTVKFMEETVFTDQPATIHGTLTLPGIKVKQELTVKGNINGKKFPESYAILKNGTVHFGNAKFDHLQINSVEMGVGATADGLSLDQIVTLSTDQYIMGEKHFTGGITVFGDLDITSKLIDGVNLDELNASIYSQEPPGDQNFDVIFGGDLTVSSIKYNGTFNNIDLSALALDVLYDDELPLTVEAPKTFKAGFTTSSAIFENTFNGEEILNLVTTDKEQVIQGKKTFVNGLIFTNIYVTGLVDNTNLTRLEQKALFIEKPGQTVTGKKIFTDGVIAEDLEISGKINGIDFKNVATLDGDQTFTAPLTINNGTFSNMNADKIIMPGPVLVNGINLTKVNENRISLSSPLKHNGAITVNGPVFVNGSLYVEKVNNYNIPRVFDNIAMKNERLTIKGRVVFSNLTVYGPITTKDTSGANRLNIKDINANAIHLNSSDIFFGSTDWEAIILEKGVIGSGLFHGYNLSELNKDAVFPDVPNQVITGKKTFVKGFHVKGNIEAASVNGVDLRKQLLTRNTEQIISTPFTFGNMTAEKNVNIFGKYNGVDMRNIHSSIMKQPELILQGNVTFHNTVDVYHLKLNGSLNGVNIADLMDDGVKLTDDDIVITGNTTFNQSPDIPNVVVDILNDVDFSDFLDHAVFLDNPAILSGTVTVHGSLNVTKVSTEELVLKGSLDGQDVLMFDDVIFLDQDQVYNASLIIKGNVHVEGDIDTTYLNGLNLESDFLTKDSVQVIPHKITFGEIWTDDVSVDGLVNNFNLLRELENTLMTTGGQTVTGLKTFTGSVTVLGNVEVLGKVGTDFKVNLGRQAVKLDEDAEIKGQLIFKDILRVHHLSSSTDMINGMNYTELCEKAWLFNKPAVITGRMKFTSGVNFEGPLIYNSTDGRPTIGELHNAAISLSDMISNNTFEFNRQYTKECHSIVSMSKKLENAIYEGHYFDTVFREKTPYRRHSSVSFQSSNKTFVVVSWESPVCDSIIYRLSPGKLEEIHTIRDTGVGHQWIYFETNTSRYLAMASSSSHNHCSRRNSAIWKINEDFTVTIHQELTPGDRISLKRLVGGGMKVFVHATDHTTTYKHNPLTQLFEEYLISNEIADIALSLHLNEGSNIMIRTYKGYGKVLVNGKAGPRQELARNIFEAVLFEQNNKVFVVTSELVFERHRLAYVIKLYSVEINSKTFRWLDLIDVASETNLTSFFAGNEAAGTTFLLIAQQNRYPLVYTILGEKLKYFAELDIPRVEWMQYAALPGSKYPAFQDHFVLFGQKNNTLLMTRLVMKGGAIPKDETVGIDCNIQFLTPESFLFRKGVPVQ